MSHDDIRAAAHINRLRLPGCWTAKTIPAEAVRLLLDYEPVTGLLRWVSSHRFAGKKAGSLDRKGYRFVKVAYVDCKAHRLAWLLMTGEHPRGEIDHINGNRDDNRWSNLRDVDAAINRQNRRVALGEIGLLGVSRCGRDTFRATIKKDGTFFHLGTFTTPEGAHAAYMDAKRRMHDGCTV